MPLLLYCVAPASAPDTAQKGVGASAVASVVESDLKFFYSETSPGDTSRDIVSAAQTVHRVVSDIFGKSAVLPFQYPTLVADERDIAKLAAERGEAFRNFLERIGSKVQMDVRLMLAPEDVSGGGNRHGSEDAARAPHQPSAATPGTAYLQARAHRQATLSAAAEICRLAAGSEEFRIRHTGENSRCQVLIDRVEVLSFFERMRTLELPDGVRAVVSGPWPPAGFWEDEPR